MRMTPEATILQITDLHIMPGPGEKLLGIDTESTFDAVLTKALADNSTIDLILLTGDLAQEPCPMSYQKIRNRLESCGIPCVCLTGNHDDYELMQEILNFGSISCRRQLILKSWQIVCLNSQIPDSPGGHLSLSELNFLEDCLRRNPERPTLIAVHHHCRKTGSMWMDTMMIDNSGELISTVMEYPAVKAIVCGHIHQEMDKPEGSIRVLGAPSTCFQFKPESSVFSLDDEPPGYRLIEVYADGRLESKITRIKENLTGLQIDSEKY